MAEEWLTPATAVGTGAAPQPERPAFELRPLSLSEILDRTFTIYRSRFWLFAGIASASAALQTAMSGIQIFFMGIGNLAKVNPTTAAVMGIGAGLGLLVMSILFLIALSMTQAATAYALSEVYLGQPMTIMESFRATRKWWYRYIGVAFWQFFSAAWIPMTLAFIGFVLTVVNTPGIGFIWFVLGLGIIGGTVFGVIQFLRNSIGVPAVVIEGLTVRAAMKRSKGLAEDAKGRLFVVFLLSVAMKYAGGLLQAPLLMFTMVRSARGHTPWMMEVITLVVIFFVDSVVEPVLMLGLTLVYFDQRVRKEALDLVMMMGPEVAAAPAATFPVEAPVAYESPVYGEVGPVAIEPVVAVEPLAAEPIVAEPSDQAGDETLP